MTEKVWPNPDEWPECQQGSRFDDVLPTREEIRAWIGSTLGVRPNVVSPGPALTSRSWSAAALFSAGEQTVVFKLIRLPDCVGCASVYQQLNVSSPARTPPVLGNKTSGSSSWLLLEYLEGQPATEAPSPERAAGIARQVARIQVEYAERFQCPPPGILDLSLSRTGSILRALIDRIESFYKPQWDRYGAVRRRNGENLAVPLPSDFLPRLKSIVDRVDKVAQEILTYGWPSTIIHTDLHPANGIVSPDGTVQIIDWDQAAFGFACESAYWLDTIADDPEWQGTGKETVRSAYLDELPWGTRDERERVWDLGARIARIYSAYQADRRNKTLARTRPWSGNIAALLLSTIEEFEEAP